MDRARATEALRRDHWDDRYKASGSSEVSWFQSRPAVSLELMTGAGLDRASAVIDVGCGASRLVDSLLSEGWSDLTVLDISDVALDEARARVGPNERVQWIEHDLLTWQPTRRYDVWHDRAVFHFLVGEEDRRQYREVLAQALAPRATVIVGTFAADGPMQCSGLSVARYDAEALTRALGASFDQVATKREEHVTPQGSTQPFTCVVLRGCSA